MEMSIFLPLAFTEILHLEKHFRVTILKWNNMFFEQLHRSEPSILQCLFFN